MKSTILLSIITSSLLLMSCSSVGTAVSEEAGRPEDSVSDDLDYYRNLADYLQQIPGVNFNSGVVTIRGYNNFDGVITPLYVIDGNPVGFSYSRANNMVDPQFIDYVRVLKGPDATIYGVRGGNGVVEIVTKKI